MHRVFDIERSVGYETLLHDVMIGDQTRFARGDTVEQAWRVMQPDGRVGNRTFPTMILAAMTRARPKNYWHAPAVGSGVQRPKLLPALATLCCVSTVRRGELNRATPTDLSDAGLTERVP